MAGKRAYRSESRVRATIYRSCGTAGNAVERRPSRGKSRRSAVHGNDGVAGKSGALPAKNAGKYPQAVGLAARGGTAGEPGARATVVGRRRGFRGAAGRYSGGAVNCSRGRLRFVVVKAVLQEFFREWKRSYRISV